MTSRKDAVYSLLESFSLALRSIRANAFRSFLTTLGIIIGVASIIAVVSIVQGLSLSISSSFKGLGANSLTVRADTSLEEVLQGKQNRLSMNDFSQLVRHIDGISHISPSFTPLGQFGVTIRNGSQVAYSTIVAATESFQDAHQTFPKYGRFITAGDNTSRRKVVVIGERLRENLHLPVDPTGKFIIIGGEWYKVIGTTEPHGEMFGISQDDYALIPFSVGQSVAGRENRENIEITFDVENVEQIEATQEKIVRLFRQLHHLKPGQRNDFKVQTARELTESFSKIIDTMAVVLGGIVSVSLLVGGIGIMNIMLVSVTERTREIGICKALGAERHHILMQFLIEAATLSMFGGLLGLALGYVLGFVIAKFIPNFPDAFVPWWAMLLSFSFSTIVGIVFGLIPAAKAANLEPIEALRYE